MADKIQLEDRNAICGKYISYLYRKSGTHFASELKILGLSSMESIVLIGIYRHTGVNQQTLSQIVSVDPGVMSRVLRTLEDNALIEKKRDELNRRNFNLYLTLSGKDLTEQSLTIQGKYWDMLLSEFTKEEIDTLNSLLRRMECRSYPNSETTAI